MQTLAFKKDGNGEKALVFLHGWPGTKDKWEEVASILKPHHTLYRVDLPGWEETPLTRAYHLSDYVEDVLHFIAEQKIQNPIIVGHSFGGRIAIKMLANHPERAQKLVLVASAGIERKSFVVKLFLFFKPFVPKFLRNFLRPLIGSRDYLRVEGFMRETFVNVIGEDLEPLLPHVATPTLLIWGEHDHMTPLWQGKLMEEKIPGARLEVIKEGDHGIPYRMPQEVAQHIASFI